MWINSVKQHFVDKSISYLRNSICTAVLLISWITYSMSLLSSAVSAIVSLLTLWWFSSMTLPTWKWMQHSTTLPTLYNFSIHFHQPAVHMPCQYISCIHKSNNGMHLKLGPLLQRSRHVHMTRTTSVGRQQTTQCAVLPTMIMNSPDTILPAQIYLRNYMPCKLIFLLTLTVSYI